MDFDREKKVGGKFNRTLCLALFYVEICSFTSV